MSSELKEPLFVSARPRFYGFMSVQMAGDGRELM